MLVYTRDVLAARASQDGLVLMLDKPMMPFWGGALLGARKDQQDSYLTQVLDSTGGLLAIVADGMGGQAAGALASQTATAAFRDVFVDLVARTSDVHVAFDGAMRAANEAIDRAQEGHREREGMGTTLLAVHVSQRGLSWISVGDSPLILCREQEISRLNDDHSLRGLPEFTGGKNGNMLRSALTGQEIALVDTHAEPMALRSGDVLILASDGILSLDEADVFALLEVSDPGRPDVIGQRLLDAVSQKNDPRQDNCTVIAIALPPTMFVRQDPPVSVGPIETRRPISARVAILVAIAIALIGAAVVAWFW